MSEYSKHHFVPQFCLREFANDKGRKQISTYLIQRNLYIPSTSIRAQAQRVRLYGSDEREQILSQIESASAAVLQRMIKDFEVPARFSEGHSTLLVHVIFQSSRTPTAGAELEEAANQMMKVVMSHDEKVAPYLDQVRLKLDDAALHTLSMAGTAIPLTIDLQYKLLHNETSTPFIISDHPVVKYNQFMERRTVDFGGTGFASRGLQIFLPVSPRVTLMLYDGDVYRVGRSSSSSVVPVNDVDVSLLNTLQVVNAQAQLFFNRQMTEETVRALVARSKPWMLNERSTITEVPQPPNELGMHRSIIITRRKDIRTGLKLRNVVELPTAQRYKIRNGTDLLRDPMLYELHFDFRRRVTQGEYGPMDFDRYLDDRDRSEIAIALGKQVK